MLELSDTQRSCDAVTPTILRSLLIAMLLAQDSLFPDELRAPIRLVGSLFICTVVSMLFGSRWLASLSIKSAASRYRENSTNSRRAELLEVTNLFLRERYEPGLVGALLLGPRPRTNFSTNRFLNPAVARLTRLAQIVAGGWIASGIPAFFLTTWVFGIAVFAAPEIRPQLLWMPTLLFIYLLISFFVFLFLLIWSLFNPGQPNQTNRSSYNNEWEDQFRSSGATNANHAPAANKLVDELISELKRNRETFSNLVLVNSSISDDVRYKLTEFSGLLPPQTILGRLRLSRATQIPHSGSLILSATFPGLGCECFHLSNENEPGAKAVRIGHAEDVFYSAAPKTDSCAIENGNPAKMHFH